MKTFESVAADISERVTEAIGYAALCFFDEDTRSYRVIWRIGKKAVKVSIPSELIEVEGLDGYIESLKEKYSPANYINGQPAPLHHPKVKSGLWHKGGFIPPAAGKLHNPVEHELARKFDCLTAMVEHPVSGQRMILSQAVQSLNDDPNRWSRDRIADWLETLDVDITMKDA